MQRPPVARSKAGPETLGSPISSPRGSSPNTSSKHASAAILTGSDDVLDGDGGVAGGGVVERIEREVVGRAQVPRPISNSASSVRSLNGTRAAPAMVQRWATYRASSSRGSRRSCAQWAMRRAMASWSSHASSARKGLCSAVMRESTMRLSMSKLVRIRSMPTTSGCSSWLSSSTSVVSSASARVVSAGRRDPVREHGLARNRRRPAVSEPA
jgi:hypothetical protein